MGIGSNHESIEVNHHSDGCYNIARIIWKQLCPDSSRQESKDAILEDYRGDLRFVFNRKKDSLEIAEIGSITRIENPDLFQIIYSPTDTDNLGEEDVVSNMLEDVFDVHRIHM